MRMIRRLLFLALAGIGGVAVVNYWSDAAWPRVSRTVLEAEHAKTQAARVANRAVTTASDTADKVGDTVAATALTAKIKSKMALDDRVNSRSINVDTSGSVVTLSGTVRSADERARAVRLARDTQGITRVIDKLRDASD